MLFLHVARHPCALLWREFGGKTKESTQEHHIGEFSWKETEVSILERYICGISLKESKESTLEHYIEGDQEVRA
ncbi:hypothetical protein A8990_11765 [Paenibacillus taihuensis]|uniref:Uncharacterized protein n=1 Tax=Paenibacillus taihuensis TaxID=1156355 RepID=A0A3D9RY13_9BACL|nr:hypothetical protein A8990_11765 [Paenibacillus taihuensis]